MKTFRFHFGRAGGSFTLQYESYQDAVSDCAGVERMCGWYTLSNLAVPAREIILIQEVEDQESA